MKNIYQNQKNEKIYHLLLISDTHQLISLWKEKYKIGKRVPNIVSHKLNESGIHKLKKKDIIKTKNISKIEINFECIRDFILMLNSRILIGDEVSLYSNMALLAKVCKYSVDRFYIKLSNNWRKFTSPPIKPSWYLTFIAFFTRSDINY